jgi:TRAP-type C4-dicarboxylate transport system substrate-binding protein
VLKNYYLQGLHQNVVNADIFNGDVWRSLTEQQQKAIEVAAMPPDQGAQLPHLENGKALQDLVENHGVILHDPPEEYFTAYAEAALRVFQQ